MQLNRQEQRMARLNEIIKLSRERGLTTQQEIDDLLRLKYPEIGYVTRTDYRQTILMLLKNEEIR